MMLPLVLIAIGVLLLGVATRLYRRLAASLDDEGGLVAIHGRTAADCRHVENRRAPSGNM